MSKIPVFDIGDTLIPSSENINRAVNDELEAQGIDEKPFFPINDFNIYKVKEVQAWLDKHSIEADAEAIRDAYLEWKDEYFKDSGILEELKKINKEFGPIGFISDNTLEAKDYYEEVFSRYNLEYRGFIVSEEAGAEKPEKEIFEEFLKRRDESAENFVYFGNYVDRDGGAEKVGMSFVWVKQFHTFDSSTEGIQINSLNYRNVSRALKQVKN
jgi:FMN phosphatase YigB (HAD superfamily)